MESERDRALRRRPSELNPERLAQATFVVQSEGVDDTWVAVYDVSREGELCAVSRRVWWFDEESLWWELDSNDSWWLPADGAMQLARALAETASGAAPSAEDG